VVRSGAEQKWEGEKANTHSRGDIAALGDVLLELLIAHAGSTSLRSLMGRIDGELGQRSR
jgi:hypothetical protein